MKRLTLKLKIILSVSLAVFIGAGVVGTTGYLSSKKIIERETNSQIENIAISYNKSLNDWVESKSNTLKSMPPETPRLMLKSTLTNY